MNKKHFTREEIVAVLDAAWREGHEYLRQKLVTPKEEQGWSGAIANIVGRLGVSKEWHEYTPPPAEARGSI